MLKKLLNRLGSVTGILAVEETVLALAGVFPISYLAALAAQWHEGAAVMFDAIPPLFWPILSVLALIVIAGRLFFLRKERWTRQKESRQSKIVDLGKKSGAISRDLRNAANPQMINVQTRDISNFPYMRDEAARAANLIAVRLRKITETVCLMPATRCQAGDDRSMLEWSEALARCAEALSANDD